MPFFFLDMIILKFCHGGIISMQAYMVELYQDTLVDLLLPKNAKRSKLEIKKDSKVMDDLYATIVILHL